MEENYKKGSWKLKLPIKKYMREGKVRLAVFTIQEISYAC